MLGPRFDDALVFAHGLHRTQVRKATAIPYVAHLLAVTALVLEHGGDEDQAIAALLHDAVEDQGGPPTLAAIRGRFGEVVADLVADLTDADTVPKPPWRARKERYLAHLAQAPAAVRLISACDKLHNARSIVADLGTLGPALWERFSGGRDGTLWYYAALVEVFTRHGPADLGRQLGALRAAMAGQARR